jgi:serine/threonine protein kinase
MITIQEMSVKIAQAKKEFQAHVKAIEQKTQHADINNTIAARIDCADLLQILHYTINYDFDYELLKITANNIQNKMFFIILAKNNTKLSRTVALKLNFSPEAALSQAVQLNIWLKSKLSNNHKDPKIKLKGHYKCYSNVLSVSATQMSLTDSGLIALKAIQTEQRLRLLDLEFNIHNMLATINNISTPVFKIGLSKSNKMHYEASYGMDLFEFYYKNMQQVNLIKYCKDILQKVAFLHEMGIAHKDIKPDNIIICNGSAYLIDFSSLIVVNKIQEMHFTEGYCPPETLNILRNPIVCTSISVSDITRAYFSNFNQDMYALYVLFSQAIASMQQAPITHEELKFAHKIANLRRDKIIHDNVKQLYKYLFDEPLILSIEPQQQSLLLDLINDLWQQTTAHKIETKIQEMLYKTRLAVSRLYHLLSNHNQFITQTYNKFMQKQKYLTLFFDYMINHLQAIEIFCKQSNDSQHLDIMLEFINCLNLSIKINHSSDKNSSFPCMDKSKFNPTFALKKQCVINPNYKQAGETQQDSALNLAYSKKTDIIFKSDFNVLDNNIELKCQLCIYYVKETFNNHRIYWPNISQYKDKNLSDLSPLLTEHIKNLKLATSFLQLHKNILSTSLMIKLQPTLEFIYKRINEFSKVVEVIQKHRRPFKLY